MTREEELLIELASLQSNPLDEQITPELTAEVFASLASIEGLLEYFKATMGQDMKRYFAASTDAERSQIKGHYSLAAYMRGKMVEAKSNLLLTK